MIDTDQPGLAEKDEASGVAIGRLRLQLMALLRRLRRESGDDGVPLSHLLLLGALMRLGGSATPTRLGLSEGLRSSNVAALLRELEKDGLVLRQPDPGDRRKMHVVRTGTGRQTFVDNRNRREAWLAQAMAACLTTEEQARLLAAGDLLERL